MGKNYTEENKRLFKNTIYLYIRSFVILCISLYTSRVVLAALGFVDHGIYNLVGGVVGIFSMFSATLAASTQRFLNIEIGKKEIIRTQQVFSASINIHICLVLVLVVLFETIGLWFLNVKLNIPADRLYAANIVYQISILTFIIKLISVPYDAVIVANEKMNVYAYVSIYEVTMKLVVLYLLWLNFMDRLILYSLLYLFIPLSIRFFYGIYCSSKFPECKYVKTSDKSLYRDMVSISGWNFLNSSACIITSSGIGVILNIFTNVVVNSAKGISGQVETVVTQFFNNFMISIRPQITKAYAVGDETRMLSLVSKGTRMGFLLLCFFCFPIIMGANGLLHLWLGKIPSFTVQFVQLTLIFLIQHSFSTVLDIVIMATGKLKVPQITLSLIQILNVPFSCLLLYWGFKPYSIYLSYIIISYITLVIRIHFSVKYSCLTWNFYMHEIIKPLFLVLLVSIFVLGFLYNIVYHQEGFVILLIEIIVSECVLLFTFWHFAAKRNEKEWVISKIKRYKILDDK